MTDNTPNGPVDPAHPIPPAEPAPVVPAAYVPPLPEAAPVVAAEVSYDPVPLQSQVDTSRNWMGIVALVFGIIGGAVIAIVFGILGLVAVKQGKANNKGMSIWGIVLAGIWIVVGIAVFIAVVVLAANAADKNSMASAEVGDCYVSTVQDSEGLVDVNPVFGPCDLATNAEVYYIGTFDGTSAPDESAFTDDLWNFCTSDAAIASVDTDIAADYYVEYYIPNADTWDSAAHTVICGLSSDSGPVDDAAVLND